MKALAFQSRGENKDAYDLYYVLRNYGSGVEDVIRHLVPFAGEPDALEAIEVLRRDFLQHEGLGPRRVAEFLEGRPDDVVQADVVGLVQRVVHEAGGLIRAETFASEEDEPDDDDRAVPWI